MSLRLADPMRPWLRWMKVILLLGPVAALACANGTQRRELQRASKHLGRSVKRGDAAEIRERVVPGARDTVDTAAMLSEGDDRQWSQALADPDQVRPEATLLLTPEYAVTAVWTEEGWRLSENPLDLYAQQTPRQALRTLVWASRNERWDVLVRLAPKRYRMGLSEDELARSWTKGEHARVLQAARDAVAEHLGDPIVSDAHEAVLEIAEGHSVRLEREGERWVVVDFLPES